MNKKHYLLLSGSAVAAAIIMVLLLVLSLTAQTDIPDTIKQHELFDSEEEYLSYIKSISFDTISFNTVTIERGDNFWKIAKDHDVNIDTLIGANPFWDTILASVDQEIVVPSERGVLHFIMDLDDIDNLCSLYGVEEKDVIVQKLPFLYRAYYKLDSDRKPIATFIRDTKPVADTMTDKLAHKYTLREMFRSPLGGRFSSFFGSRRHPIFNKRRFHNGVDIAARYGTLVGAAHEGVVHSTGWMGGYGKAVIIRHPNGYKTLYGHLSKIFVRPGQKVSSGRLIGRVGSTGWSTGPHLHFTLWHNGKLINPMKILW